MKIFKSIKWRLQLWYGLMLVAVLAGFGFTAYRLESSRQFRRVDDELHRRIVVLANALRRPPPQPDDEAEPFGNRPPPPRQFSEADLPEQNPPPRMPREFHLPAEDEHFFEASDPNQFYFLIVHRNGVELARSKNQPEPTAAAERAETFQVEEGSRLGSLPKKDYQPQKTIGFQNYREMGEVLPMGDFIRVGCSIAPELKELQRAKLNLLGVGSLILMVGLAGGSWLVARSLKPINEISATAVKISAGDLSQRINVAEAESELGQLASVLNSTFARLETAFAQQKQFASDAAHELRTPVSVILTQTQTALNREREAASYKQTVEACQRAAQRMRKLIESLLALARFDAGQEVLKRTPFDFSKTIFDCVELVQPLAEERAVRISVKAKPLEIIGDSGRLAQVVTNLLTNAIQYNQPEGEVCATLEIENSLAVLKIADTGNGIAPEDLPRVFGRFFRADASRTGAGNSGLGLAICKAIVEAHGGTIEVASEENVGTTFTVRLPL